MADMLSLQESLLYARIANGAYKIDRSSVRFGGHSWRFVYDDDSDFLCIAIKGSDSREEWMHNAAMPYGLLLESQVRFFSQNPQVRLRSELDNFSYALVAKKIVESALTRYPRAQDVKICGHSKGGLLAVFCGFILTNVNLQELRIFAFGAPNLFYRPNDRYTAEKLEALNEHLVWVRHEHDDVPGIANGTRDHAASPHLYSKLKDMDGIMSFELRGPVIERANSIETYIAGLETMIEGARRDTIRESTRMVVGAAAWLFGAPPPNQRQNDQFADLVTDLVDNYLRK